MMTTEAKTTSRWPIRVPAWDVHDTGEYPGRHLGAVATDMLLQVAVAVIVAFGVGGMDQDPNLRAWLIIVVYMAASFTNRVVVQSVWQRTVGKALFGLRIVREDTRGRVSFWPLVGWWLLGTVLAAVAMVLEGL
jgi:uncharacterized RDD family membrane protein YckC